jgi:hypothetical protein
LKPAVAASEDQKAQNETLISKHPQASPLSQYRKSAMGEPRQIKQGELGERPLPTIPTPFIQSTHFFPKLGVTKLRL